MRDNKLKIRNQNNTTDLEEKYQAKDWKDQMIQDQGLEDETH
jgi:hypothetical protein